MRSGRRGTPPPPKAATCAPPLGTCLGWRGRLPSRAEAWPGLHSGPAWRGRARLCPSSLTSSCSSVGQVCQLLARPASASCRPTFTQRALQMELGAATCWTDGRQQAGTGQWPAAPHRAVSPQAAACRHGAAPLPRPRGYQLSPAQRSPGGAEKGEVPWSKRVGAAFGVHEAAGGWEVACHPELSHLQLLGQGVLRAGPGEPAVSCLFLFRPLADTCCASGWLTSNLLSRLGFGCSGIQAAEQDKSPGLPATARLLGGPTTVCREDSKSGKPGGPGQVASI